MASKYTPNYKRLVEQVGGFLGLGDNFQDIRPTPMAQIRKVLDMGINDFMFPRGMQGQPYVWSFSRKEVTISITQGNHYVTLDPAIGEIHSPLAPVNTNGDNVITGSIQQVPFSQVRAALNWPAAVTFAPTSFCVVDKSTLIETTPTLDGSTVAWPAGSGELAILFDRIVDKDYDYTAVATLNLDKLQYAEEDWFGGPAMHNAILTCCLASAEQLVDGKAGVYSQRAPQVLAEAVARDARKRKTRQRMLNTLPTENVDVGDLRDVYRRFR